MARLPYLVLGLAVLALAWLPLPDDHVVEFFGLWLIAYLVVGVIAGRLLPLKGVVLTTVAAHVVFLSIFGWVFGGHTFLIFLGEVAAACLAGCLGALAGHRLGQRAAVAT